jgi:pyruvate,water dikinase
VIVWLDDSGCVAEVVGPKAAGLGRLRRAGLPVPDGFCVPAQASLIHMRATGLDESVERLFETAQAGGDWRRQAILLRAALAEAPVPPDVADALRQAMARLGAHGRHRRARWAVRSSALVEDRPGASFAGLFSTFLGVVGHADLLAAVRSCWAVRFSDPVIRYALGRGLDLLTTTMAVLVQTTIAARAAGTALSVDAPGTMVITAAWGLGRAVADGAVVPDWWRLERAGLTVRERRPGHKSIAARLDRTSGEVWRRQSRQRAVEPCLEDSTLGRLGALVLQAERTLDSPQEVEWAQDQQDRLWLVQARPLGPPSPGDASVQADGIVAWLRNGDMVEGQPTSPGQVVGRARVLNGVDALQSVQPGDVVVARHLPPTTTAILPRVSGLVVETAGSTAHAATLARERGIPAIMGAIGATQCIPDGALVLVDGTVGRAWYRSQDSASPLT